MQLHLRAKLPLPRREVWQALNDPVLLQECLPGCESFERADEDSFDLVLMAKVGPVKARFKGQVFLTEVVAPQSCRMHGAGKGGVAGFVKGDAEIRLEALFDDKFDDQEEAMTEMTCIVTATVGGKLAQVGSRLVSGAARKLATEFFTRFVQVTVGEDAEEVALEAIIRGKD